MFDLSDDVGGCKSREPHTLSWVKVIDGLEQPKVSDVDQVILWYSSVLKAFGETLHKTWGYMNHQPAVPFCPRNGSRVCVDRP